MDPRLLEDDDLKQVANLNSANPPRVSYLLVHPFTNDETQKGPTPFESQAFFYSTKNQKS